MSITIINPEDIPSSAPFMPRKIWPEGARYIFSSSPSSVREYGRTLIRDNWRIFAVNQSRGYCYFRRKVITIPSLVINKGGGELCWYISHEMSHAFSYISGYQDNHGPHFMQWLKEICPPEYWHFETSYKPRNAKAAGISSNSLMNSPIDFSDLL